MVRWTAVFAGDDWLLGFWLFLRFCGLFFAVGSAIFGSWTLRSAATASSLSVKGSSTDVMVVYMGDWAILIE